MEQLSHRTRRRRGGRRPSGVGRSGVGNRRPCPAGALRGVAGLGREERKGRGSMGVESGKGNSGGGRGPMGSSKTGVTACFAPPFRFGSVDVRGSGSEFGIPTRRDALVRQTFSFTCAVIRGGLLCRPATRVRLSLPSRTRPALLKHNAIHHRRIIFTPNSCATARPDGDMTSRGPNMSLPAHARGRAATDRTQPSTEMEIGGRSAGRNLHPDAPLPSPVASDRKRAVPPITIFSPLFRPFATPNTPPQYAESPCFFVFGRPPRRCQWSSMNVRIVHSPIRPSSIDARSRTSDVCERAPRAPRCYLSSALSWFAPGNLSLL